MNDLVNLVNEIAQRFNTEFELNDVTFFLNKHFRLFLYKFFD